MKLNTAGEIIEARRFLEGKFSQRDQAYRTLRKLYNAEYWDDSAVQGIKLVYNLLATVVDRYTDFMVLPPDWQTLPADVTPEAMATADKQEKILYSQWELNNILELQQWQAHLQSMLGMFGFIVMPNFGHKEKYVTISSIIPEYSLPMPKSDNIHDLEFVIVKGYDYNRSKNLFEPDLRPDQKQSQVNTVAYFDDEKIVMLEDGKESWRITHNFGFIPVVFGQNHPKPHAIEGIGDLDQAVGLNQYLNELLSWQADILEYAANPIVLIRGLIGDQKLTQGPGGQWYLPQGADASFLTWPGQAPTVENMFGRIIQAIQDTTNMSDPLYGRDVPSGTSGAAVQSFLSGIHAAMLRKQMALGSAYVRVNEIIFKILEKMFGNKEIVVRGTKRGNIFVERMKGSEINGNTRNRAIWPPGVLDLSSRINMETAKLSARLQSRRTTMENIGIQSPDDEMKRIAIEDEYEIARQARLQNPSGLPPQQSNEMATAAQQLQKLAGPQGGSGGAVQELVSAIQAIPKIKDAVFFVSAEGDKFTIALASMADKSTIVNRLPDQFKGKVTFRKYNPDTDGDLQVITEPDQAAA